MAIGLAMVVTIRTLHGETNAIGAKNRNQEEMEAAAAAALETVAVAVVLIVVRHVVVAVDRVNFKIEVVIKAQCGVVMIEETTATDHTKNPFDLMITDFYI